MSFSALSTESDFQRDLDTMHDALRALSANDRDSSAYATLKSLLRGSLALSALNIEPPFDAPAEALHRWSNIFSAVNRCFMCLSNLYELAREKKHRFGHLIESPPVPLAKALQWIEYMHPAKAGRLLVASGEQQYDFLHYCVFLRMLLVCGKDYMARFVYENPRIFTITLDVWLFHPTYIAQGHYCNINYVAITLEVCAAHNGLVLSIPHIGAETTYDVYGAELNQLVHGRHSQFLRCLIVHIRRLLLLGIESEDSMRVWYHYFQTMITVLRHEWLKGAKIPRDLIRLVIAGVRHCLRNGEAFPQIGRDIADRAALILVAMMSSEENMRNTTRAFEVGVIPFFFEINAILGRLDSIRKLELCIGDSFWSLRLLRLFRLQLRQAVESGVVSAQQLAKGKILVDLSTSRWKAYMAMRHNRNWQALIACNNTDTSITSIFKDPIDRVVCLVVNMGGCAAEEEDPYGYAVEMVARDEKDEDPTRIQIWVRLTVEGKPVMHRLPFTYGPEDFGAGAINV
uniref:Uncharacterized protein n=1 Tax=Schizophyllum commune (strain H4-8 / FGSC 9210) TaxID=578458 RepID=D8Q6N8_SCHCM